MARHTVVQGRVIKDESSSLEIRINKHPKRRNNLRVAVMYEAYKSGQSLGKIAKTYGVSRQAVYDVFQSRKYTLRSKKLNGLQIVDNIRFSLMKGGYLRGSVNGQRVLMHHYIWKKETGREVPRGYCLRHKDGNKENNTFSNLELLTVEDCSRLYSPHLNQFTSPFGSRIVRRNRFGGGHRYAKK